MRGARATKASGVVVTTSAVRTSQPWVRTGPTMVTKRSSPNQPRPCGQSQDWPDTAAAPVQMSGVAWWRISRLRRNARIGKMMPAAASKMAAGRVRGVRSHLMSLGARRWRLQTGHSEEASFHQSLAQPCAGARSLMTWVEESGEEPCSCGWTPHVLDSSPWGLGHAVCSNSMLRPSNPSRLVPGAPKKTAWTRGRRTWNWRHHPRDH